ncbi:helix-turn-helix domain-containing protein [Virgibacillus salexigens]|nr:response regulator transcription factor [Virgibacillus massiliensis]
MNKKEIGNTLRDYKWMINEIKRQREFLKDAGTNLVAQSGIESAMPKAQGGTSDPVAREVVRRDKKYTWINRLERKVTYIQERIPAISNERELVVLECLLDGMSMRAISNHMGLSERHIFRIRDAIVSQMADMSYLSHIMTEEKRCV